LIRSSETTVSSKRLPKRFVKKIQLRRLDPYKSSPEILVSLYLSFGKIPVD